MQLAKRAPQLDLEERTKAISILAQADRTALEERILLSRQVEQADIILQQIYMERRFQEIRGEIYREAMEHGPSRKLPGEMVSIIFRHHVENDISPWALVKVCKMWMHMAMMTPQLWCHVFSFPDKGDYHGRIRSYVVNAKVERSLRCMQMCINQTQVQAAIDWSASRSKLLVEPTWSNSVDLSLIRWSSAL